jgi:ribonuclease Z
MLQFEKCIEMGVPLGPLLGKLKAGIDVTLHDGTLVKASDVTSPDDPGPIFIGKRIEEVGKYPEFFFYMH